MNKQKLEDIQTYAIAVLMCASFCLPIVDSTISMIKEHKKSSVQKTVTNPVNKPDSVNCYKCYFEKQR